MKLVHESHQLNFFVSNKDIEVIPQLISELRDLFSDLNLAPTYGQEFNAISGEKKDILMLTSADKTLRIEFPSHAILITKEGCSSSEFKDLYFRLLQGIGTLFRFKRGYRISILNIKFYNGSNDQYSSLYNRLFTYNKINPFEWDNRIAEKRFLEKSKEEINSITTIRRLEAASPFLNKGAPQDCIIFEIDSNTVPQNTSNRFGLNDSLNIYEELYNNNERLTEELNRYF